MSFDIKDIDIDIDLVFRLKNSTIPSPVEQCRGVVGNFKGFGPEWFGCRAMGNYRQLVLAPHFSGVSIYANVMDAFRAHRRTGA